MMLLQLGSEFFNESALRGRIALPVKETRFQEARIQRRMGCFDLLIYLRLMRLSCSRNGSQ